MVAIKEYCQAGLRIINIVPPKECRFYSPNLGRCAIFAGGRGCSEEAQQHENPLNLTNNLEVSQQDKHLGIEDNA